MRKIFSSAYRLRLLHLCIVIAGLFLAFLSIKNATTIGDEGFHTERVNNFANGTLDLATPSTFPGYHAVLALFSVLLEENSLVFFRFINFLFAIVSIVVFYLACGALDPKSSRIKTLQYVFNPVLFPFFFLLYTDLFSLLLVLASFLLHLRKQYAFAAIMCIAAARVRQNNILWLGFLLLCMFWEELPHLLAPLPRRLQAYVRRLWPSLRPAKFLTWRIAIACAVFVAGGAAFVQFVRMNGGVALGDKWAHPFPSFHVGNIFFVLALSFVLFLPLHIANIPAMIRKFRESPLLRSLLFLLFLVYLIFFVNDHPYNQGTDLLFLRNPIMVFAAANVWHKILFFIPIMITVVSLSVTRFVRPVFLLLYPFSIVFLGMSWLVEPRYYLIPLSLFILFRTERSEKWEIAFVLYGCVFALVLFVPIALHRLFI